MSFKHWTAGLVLTAGLAGCAPADPPAEASAPTEGAVSTDLSADTYLSYANDAFTVSGVSEADLSGLVASLPAYASLTWDTKTFDADSGATVFEGLALGFGGEEKFGIKFETAKLWGYEDELLLSRMAGERLSETGALFTRLEGTNMTYFGVVPALNSIFNETLEQLDAELPEGFEFGFDRFDSNTERFVMSGVSLRPWELSLLPAEKVTDFDADIPAEVVDIIHGGQRLIAVSRSLAIEKSVSLDTDFTFEMRQPGAETSMAVSIEVAAAEGIQGFDIEKNFTRGYSGSQTNTYSDEVAPGEVVTLSGFPAGFTMAQQESYETSELRNMKLDKLMGFLARSELPMMDERDLLSLGTWEVANYVSQLNDKTILTAERGFFNAENFEWVIPSKLSFGVSGAQLNTEELGDFFFTFFETFFAGVDMDELPEDEREEMELVREGVEKAMELLPEHGLNVLPFEMSVTANWAADSGPTDFAFEWDADGFGKTELTAGITLPTYESLQAAFEAEDRGDAFETAFLEAFSFRGARWFEQDKGVYDKLFGFANALGKEYPDEGWGAMLGSMEPAQMRSYLGTMTRMGKASASAEFPPAAEWLESIATYLETGGSIEIASNPPRPIDEELIDSYEDDPEPEEIVEILGLTVTHTK
jgi:hypothetical protein